MHAAIKIGQQVTIRGNRAQKRERIDGLLHHITKRGTAIVMVPREVASLDSDDEDLHEVSVDDLVPYRPKVTTVRSKHVAKIVRMLKQGITVFRIGERGVVVQIDSYDVEDGTTVARTLKGRPRYPALHELVPNLVPEK